MTKRELCQVLETLGVHPSRRFGQNFLIDPNMLAALVADAAPRAGERVLEVGPGTGVLTRELLAAGCHVTAVELDLRLADYLEAELGGHERFALVRGDACKLSIGNLMGSAPYRCIANLPYACSSVFLARLVQAETPPQDCHVLLQREMADRLAASPRSKDYGALTVQIGLRYRARIVRRVPREVFFPPPDVVSVFVALTRRRDGPGVALAAQAGRLAALAFSQRRKKAIGRIAGAIGTDRTREAFHRLGINENARAEEIAVDTFAALAACLHVDTQHIHG